MQKITDAYLIWHRNLPNLSRLSRYTLGEKIDKLFTDTIEYILLAGYTSKNQKLAVVDKASTKLDSLKHFLFIANELKLLEDRKYLELATPLVEVGKQLGGWHKLLAQSAPKI
ncbi:MAG: hypothetical protein COU10_01020 [Candidatus Harrisonbacteria bacterium CG10_big_fil_rev_8_21_14_0_10_45_28]|uniref:bAvd-like domain-containing protein n=1 Tax=Candidatus Harrisonbacteria bacterium CG10_big_fil_rev_8_21_14_0_10_45_28 TaxID=1974586 RepID=A0A2H0UNT4_9BACT|nr:MAG: hypothetical protein COU10_01020 [Candidatus Harrisonbacteria bacterium CG10_big_fil_rev_8_21_14_0_10_45_28]